MTKIPYDFINLNEILKGNSRIPKTAIETHLEESHTPQEQSWEKKVSNVIWLVVEPTPLKNMIVKMGSSSPIFPNFWDENI